MSFTITFRQQTRAAVKVDAANADGASGYYMLWSLVKNGETIDSAEIEYSSSAPTYPYTFPNFGPGNFTVYGRLYYRSGSSSSLVDQSSTTYSLPCFVNIYSNDGHNNVQGFEVAFGDDFVIPECPFSAPSGKQFAGYAGTASATSAQFQPGQTTTVYVDRSFYCVWESIVRPTYTVSYNANGGYNAPATQYVQAGDVLTISTSIPLRSGYNFQSWVAVGDSGYTQRMSPGETITGLNENIVLKAEWYMYDISLYAGDYISSVTMAFRGLPYIQYDGTTITSSEISCTLSNVAGYTVSFDGWYNSSGTKVSSSQAYTISNLTADLSLTAKGTATQAETYTVTYNPGANGTGNTQSENKLYDISLTLAGAIFTRTGYTQTGWATSDGGAKVYELGGLYSANASITLYPTWEKNPTDPSKTYTVTYNPGNLGFGIQQTAIKTEGIPLVLAGGIFSSNGYVQIGWATSDNGDRAYFLSGLYTNDEDITLYPTWVSNNPGPDTPGNTADANAQRTQDYFKQLRTSFTKLCRLRFLQPDGSTAFAVDNNPLGLRSGTFIQEGNITCNLQNGQRRTASVTLSNIDAEYDYNINNIWFGQQIAIDEGLILPDGSEYYIQQGVFYIADPQETLNPNLRTMTYPLVDKWAYLDGSLFGRLEATYEVPVGTNIFEPIAALLNLDKGNGNPVDRVTPIFTDYYNGMTQTLPDGTPAFLTDSPYTLRVDSDDGTSADVVLGLAEMVNAWVGYDQTGALRVDPSQDDIVDANKPVLWRFSTDEAQLIGATYTIKNTEVYNDYIVLGEQTDDNPQSAGRAQNLDPSSDTNVNIIGRKTYRETASGYYTATQCRDLAEWKLKRATVLQKAISISCIQMMHIFENNLVEIVRTDKPGFPLERHLIQGYTRPLASNGTMTINAVSVADFPVATLKSWPSYTVTYLPGASGSGSSLVAEKETDIPLTLAGAIFTRTGYTQTGWATSEAGSKVYQLSGLYTENAPLILYPFWTANT